MATAQHATVWVKLEDGVLKRASTIVQVPSGAFVDNVIEAALHKMRQDHDPILITATIKGEELKRDHVASSLPTSCDDPIVLTIRGEGTTSKRPQLDWSQFSLEGSSFMSALLNAAFSDDGHILTFSESPPWSYKKYKALYIRKCYADLHDIIWNTDQNVVVVGSPGVGKSFFAVYELYRALIKHKAVVFQSVLARKTYMFRPGAGVKELPYPNAPTLSKTGQTLLLYDAGTRSAPQFSNICDRIIVFSSPCETSYRDLLKEGASMLCMPTWSWDEIDYYAKSMGLDMTLVYERFKKYGGIARFVLEVNQKVAQRQSTELDRAIRHCDASKLLEVVRAQDRDEEGHNILHRTVVEKEDGTPDYCCYNFEFASRYVEEEVYKVLKQKTNIGVMDFLHDCRNHPHLAVIQGSLFKQMAHDLLVNGGKFKVRKLGQENEENIEIKRREKVYVHTLDHVDADQSKYFVPELKTHKTVDAIAPPDKAFQMTVNTIHPIYSDGLKDAIEFCGTPCCFQLIFVVPEYIYDDFRKQAYATTNSKRLEESDISVEEYVLCIPLPK